MLFKGTLVGSALCGMLSVYKRIILFSVLISVCKGYFYIFALNMNNGVKPIVGHAVVQQVGQSVTTNDAPTVVHNGQARIKIGVVA